MKKKTHLLLGLSLLGSLCIGISSCGGSKNVSSNQNISSNITTSATSSSVTSSSSSSSSSMHSSSSISSTSTTSSISSTSTTSSMISSSSLSVTSSSTVSSITTSEHVHVYDQQEIDEKYLNKNATCTTKAKYFYSCTCGEKGSESFEFGEPLGHDFSRKLTFEIYLCSNADCNHPSTYYYCCSRCNEKGNTTYEVGSPLGHSIDYQVDAINYIDGTFTLKSFCKNCSYIKGEETVSSLNNLTFQIISEEEKTCKLTQYSPYYNDERDLYVVIPETYNGYTVTEIGSLSLGSAKIKSLYISNKVETISNYALEGSHVEYIHIGANVSSIETMALSYLLRLNSITVDENNTHFYVTNNCLIHKDTKKLTRAYGKFTIPSDGSVTTIGEWAISGNISITEVVIPQTITEIKERAFYGSQYITSITLPDDLIYLGEEAFSDCSGLRSLHIGPKLASIDPTILRNCDSMETITVDKDNPSYYVVDNCLVDKSNHNLVIFINNDPIQSEGTILSLGTSFVSDPLSLYRFKIPSSITKISEYAFECCFELEIIRIPLSVNIIENSAFLDCTNLIYVYYEGSEEDWNKISIAENNENLTSATIYFNSY